MTLLFYPSILSLVVRGLRVVIVRPHLREMWKIPALFLNRKYPHYNDDIFEVVKSKVGECPNVIWEANVMRCAI